jgi:hypothetical protein
MSPTASERNQRVTEILNELFKRADSSKPDSSHLPPRDLEKLFSTDSWGFREIVLVIVVARLLDESYQATKSFYDCNPRALFEGPIRDALLSRAIPHRKSGPLNIAKATERIDSQWAAQRRPQDVAEVVVRLVNVIDSLSEEDLKNFAANFLTRFLNEAKRIESLTIEVSPDSDPINLFRICRQLIIEAPDGGNTPQRIVGFLLETYHEELKTGVLVSGHLDRASVTNTTSKKPGDILETLEDGTILQIFEVTVKRFDAARIRDSSDSVKAILGDQHSEVIVICREDDLPDNVTDDNDSGLYLGSLEFEGLIYRFIDIYEWIIAQLIRMPPNVRVVFYKKLQDYISEPNTAERVKVLWRRLHEGSEASTAKND